MKIYRYFGGQGKFFTRDYHLSCFFKPLIYNDLKIYHKFFFKKMHCLCRFVGKYGNCLYFCCIELVTDPTFVPTHT